MKPDEENSGAGKKRGPKSASKYAILMLDPKASPKYLVDSDVKLVLGKGGKPFASPTAADEHVMAEKLAGPYSIICIRSVALAEVVQSFATQKIEV